MNTKTWIGAVLLSLAAAAAPAGDGFSFVYRGRIDPDGVTMPETVEAVFSLYTALAGGAPEWTSTNAVFPSADGVFQCELGGDGLAAAFTNAGARFLGVALAGGEEQHPRQEILAAPLAARAATAGGLVPGGSIGTLDAPSVVAASATFHALQVNGPLDFYAAGSSLRLDRTEIAGALRLRRSGRVSVFRDAMPDHYSFESLSTGTVLFRTESGGVLTVLSDPSHWGDSDAVPCACWAVPPGDVSPPFDVGHPVRVYFYPFGASN